MLSLNNIDSIRGLEILASDWLTQRKDCNRHRPRSMGNSNVLPGLQPRGKSLRELPLALEIIQRNDLRQYCQRWAVS